MDKPKQLYRTWATTPKPENPSPHDLAERLKLVLALHSMGLKPRSIAYVLNRGEKPKGWQREFVYWVLDHKEPLVQRCVKEGLPVGMYVPLPGMSSWMQSEDGRDRVHVFKIRCPACGVLLTQVPCVACCQAMWINDQVKSGAIKHLKDLSPTGEIRDIPDNPCAGAPGSKDKIEAMRERFSRGLHLYHPDDE